MKIPDRMLPEIDSMTALFLDFDGTLVPFAPEPDAIVVPDFLPDLLVDLSGALGGALALVSGRSIESIDRHIGRRELIVAGEHGAQWRSSGGQVQALATADFSEELQQTVQRFGETDGVLVETKAAGFAVHTRRAPSQRNAVDRFMRELVAGRKDLELVAGKAVCELRSVNVSKAVAIETMMQRQPFQGRHPVFVGDDVTDEDGFRAVAAMGGVGVKIGDGDTIAPVRLESVSEVHRWLQEVNDRLSANNKVTRR